MVAGFFGAIESISTTTSISFLLFNLTILVVIVNPRGHCCCLNICDCQFPQCLGCYTQSHTCCMYSDRLMCKPLCFKSNAYLRRRSDHYCLLCRGNSTCMNNSPSVSFCIYGLKLLRHSSSSILIASMQLLSTMTYVSRCPISFTLFNIHYITIFTLLYYYHTSHITAITHCCSAPSP